MPRERKPHKNEKCFRCKQPYGMHNTVKPCNSFEFVPYSSRHRNDVLFCANFASESSNETWTVRVYKQGDASCNCMGFRFHRKCEHVTDVLADPEKYRTQQAGQLSAGAGSVAGTVAALNIKMTELEDAVKRGDMVELARLEGEIEYQRAVFSAAGAGLAERFDKVKSNIHRHLTGEVVETKVVEQSVVNIDDPFGE